METITNEQKDTELTRDQTFVQTILTAKNLRPFGYHGTQYTFMKCYSDMHNNFISNVVKFKTTIYLYNKTTWLL